MDTSKHPTAGVHTEWKVVTPSLAAAWLEDNKHNRKARESVVTRYAADMRAGNWRPTHQGIAFNCDGTLLDGQHRLLAVIESKADVVLQVTTGLPSDSQNVIDDGLGRTVLDVMRLTDGSDTGLNSLHISIAKRMLEGLNNHQNSQGFSTRLERMAFLKKHMTAINFAIEQFPASKRVTGVTKAGTLAAIARAFYHESSADLEQFCEVLASGVNRDQRDLVVIKLRNYLLTHQKNAGGRGAFEAYAKTIRVVRAFCRCEEIKYIVNAQIDPYPLTVGD